METKGVKKKCEGREYKSSTIYSRKKMVQAKSGKKSITFD
jgi:hypothetical protein